jgi:hypothetical protein
MNLGRLRARTLRERVILLLLPVLAFRLLFPAGFMPRFGDDLELSMQMCHGDAQSAAVMRLLDEEPSAPDSERDSHSAPCVFAALGAFAAPEPPSAGIAIVAHDPIEPAPLERAPALRLPHRPQSPRAPPLPV